jgi:hypothetical protein
MPMSSFLFPPEPFIGNPTQVLVAAPPDNGLYFYQCIAPEGVPVPEPVFEPVEEPLREPLQEPLPAPFNPPPLGEPVSEPGIGIRLPPPRVAVPVVVGAGALAAFLAYVTSAEGAWVLLLLAL